MLRSSSQVVGIELLAAVQALDLLAPLTSTVPLEAVRALLRSKVLVVIMMVGRAGLSRYAHCRRSSRRLVGSASVGGGVARFLSGPATA